MYSKSTPARVVAISAASSVEVELMARTPDPSDAEFVRRVREPRAKSAEPGRHRARRAAMMLLYRSDLVEGDLEAAMDTFEQDHETPLAEYSRELVRDVAARQGEFDEAISSHLDGWTVDRLGTVERSVLRISMSELHKGEVPHEVVIDEAVELAKRYASPDAAKLVNGVLGGWVRANLSESK